MLFLDNRCSSTGGLTFILSVLFLLVGWFFLGQEKADKCNAKKDAGRVWRQGGHDSSWSCVGQGGSSAQSVTAGQIVANLREWQFATCTDCPRACLFSTTA